jgi:hypothetical protein
MVESPPDACSTAVASHRAEHSLPALQTFIIDVISSDNTNIEDAEMLKSAKISSTFIREWIVKNQA